jgi:hypothetical protein
VQFHVLACCRLILASFAFAKVTQWRQAVSKVCLLTLLANMCYFLLAKRNVLVRYVHRYRYAGALRFCCLKYRDVCVDLGLRVRRTRSARHPHREQSYVTEISAILQIDPSFWRKWKQTYTITMLPVCLCIPHQLLNAWTTFHETWHV